MMENIDRMLQTGDKGVMVKDKLIERKQYIDKARPGYIYMR
jgi:hypothetical protein